MKQLKLWNKQTKEMTRTIIWHRERNKTGAEKGIEETICKCLNKKLKERIMVSATNRKKRIVVITAKEGAKSKLRHHMMIKNNEKQKIEESSISHPRLRRSLIWQTGSNDDYKEYQRKAGGDFSTNSSVQKEVLIDKPVAVGFTTSESFEETSVWKSNNKKFFWGEMFVQALYWYWLICNKVCNRWLSWRSRDNTRKICNVTFEHLRWQTCIYSKKRHWSLWKTQERNNTVPVWGARSLGIKVGSLCFVIPYWWSL